MLSFAVSWVNFCEPKPVGGWWGQSPCPSPGSKEISSLPSCPRKKSDGRQARLPTKDFVTREELTHECFLTLATESNETNRVRFLTKSMLVCAAIRVE